MSRGIRSHIRPLCPSRHFAAPPSQVAGGREDDTANRPTSGARRHLEPFWALGAVERGCPCTPSPGGPPPSPQAGTAGDADANVALFLERDQGPPLRAARGERMRSVDAIDDPSARCRSGRADLLAQEAVTSACCLDDLLKRLLDLAIGGGNRRPVGLDHEGNGSRREVPRRNLVSSVREVQREPQVVEHVSQLALILGTSSAIALTTACHPGSSKRTSFPVRVVSVAIETFRSTTRHSTAHMRYRPERSMIEAAAWA